MAEVSQSDEDQYSPGGGFKQQRFICGQRELFVLEILQGRKFLEGRSCENLLFPAMFRQGTGSQIRMFNGFNFPLGLDDPGQFFIHVVGRIPSLNEFQENHVQSAYESVSSGMAYINSEKFDATTLSAHIPCVAKWTVDGHWYPAVVTNSRGGNYYNVFFVDYGNSCEVMRPDIKPLLISPELINTPAFAVSCKLDGIVPNASEQWSEDAVALCEYFVGDSTELYCNFISKSDNDVGWSVEIENENGEKLSERLFEANLGVRSGPTSRIIRTDGKLTLVPQLQSGARKRKWSRHQQADDDFANKPMKASKRFRLNENVSIVRHKSSSQPHQRLVKWSPSRAYYCVVHVAKKNKHSRSNFKLRHNHNGNKKRHVNDRYRGSSLSGRKASAPMAHINAPGSVADGGCTSQQYDRHKPSSTTVHRDAIPQGFNQQADNICSTASHMNTSDESLSDDDGVCNNMIQQKMNLSPTCSDTSLSSDMDPNTSVTESVHLAPLLSPPPELQITVNAGQKLNTSTEPSDTTVEHTRLSPPANIRIDGRKYCKR